MSKGKLESAVTVAAAPSDNLQYPNPTESSVSEEQTFKWRPGCGTTVASRILSDSTKTVLSASNFVGCSSSNMQGRAETTRLPVGPCRAKTARLDSATIG